MSDEGSLDEQTRARQGGGDGGCSYPKFEFHSPSFCTIPERCIACGTKYSRCLYEDYYSCPHCNKRFSSVSTIK